MGYLVYIDKGRFWDILPFVSIPVIIISLILIIFNFIRRTKGSSFFIIFFLLSIAGLILSDIFGPSVLAGKAQKSYDNEDYFQSINYYNALLENYPNSRFADNALKNISLAYYLNSDYPDAIESLEVAIDSKTVSENDLEIKNILELMSEDISRFKRDMEETRYDIDNTYFSFITFKKKPLLRLDDLYLLFDLLWILKVLSKTSFYNQAKLIFFLVF